MNKSINTILTLLLLALLFALIYLVWLNFPGESVNFEDYQANISDEFPLQSAQFYNNMRYPTEVITYGFATQCSNKKREEVEKAIQRLETKTILKFSESSNPQITITCSQISPEPEQEGHFVAGEGGPTLIINATRYSVITAGKISLFRASKCDQPQIATHEILHALGFDHNSNPNSIMYPITSCEQEIEEALVKDIERLYSQKPLGDLIIEKAEAIKKGIYLDLEVTISNHGLKSISESYLKLYAESKEIRNFDLEEIDIGSKKTLTIQNLRIPRGAETLILEVQTSEEEITKANNNANLKLEKTE